MSRRVSADEVLSSLSPSDCEEFSLFLRYPEIDFDKIENENGQTEIPIPLPGSCDNLDSSPLSTTPSVIFRHQSLVTNSTAHTTPLRVVVNEENVEFGGWNEFIYLMQQSDLPQEALQYLTSIGQTILNIGTILHSTLRPNQPSSIIRIGRYLLKNIKYSSSQVHGQVEAIAQLELLVAFNVEPDESQIWASYRQRARLIAKNVSLPSQREHGLIESLTFLYDAYVYHPFLQLHTLDHYDEHTTRIIHEIYNQLMSWQERYKMWMKGVMRLRTKYMQPLLQSLSNSGAAREEIADLQDRVTKAKAAQARPVVTTLDLAEEPLVSSLNLSARRPGPRVSMKRLKTRYKREHTF